MLSKETDKARKLHEYDWMELFAAAWVKAEPGNERAYEDLGTALIRSKQPQRAIEVGEKLINLSRMNYTGYQIVGRAYNLLGDWVEASKWLEDALHYVPRDFKQFVLIDLLESYEKLEMVDEALGILTELIPLSDKYSRSSLKQKYNRLIGISRRINKY
jgi:tetratricopeptide (TPR) repeat protein